jgi:hypothetical protein
MKNPHRHKHGIADADALCEYVRKLSRWESHQQRRERLLKALAGAVEQGNQSTDEGRKAFFHGLLTGYALP